MITVKHQNSIFIIYKPNLYDDYGKTSKSIFINLICMMITVKHQKV